MTAWRVLVAITVIALVTAVMGGCLFGKKADDGAAGGGAAGTPPGASEGLPGPGGDAPGAPDSPEAGAPPPGAPGTPAPEAGAEAAPAGGPGAPGPGAPGPGGPGPEAGAPGPGMGPEGAPPGAMGAPAPSSGSAAKGLQLKHAGDYDAAANEFRGAMAANPDDEKAIWGLAWVLAEQGESDPAKRQEAKGLFEKFVGMSGDSAKVSEAKAALGRIG
ncbi:MAG TPA: hypothetical protein DGT21_01260 [Armatimonadetes bacterium]|nr:hypothetical protein [Armatimonadota bacterium]